MLLSMTGFGDARGQNGRLSVAVEVRAVNNRYLKIVSKLPERYQAIEGDLEHVIRASISRGTVTIAVRIESNGRECAYRVDDVVLDSYWRQLQGLTTVFGIPAPAELSGLLQLPGVIVERNASDSDPRGDWPLIESTLRQALGRLHDFRMAEGAAMEKDLRDNLTLIARELDKVAELAPQTVRDYREKLYDRVKELLREGQASLSPADLIREVSIFAERSDISEEILRLRSHLEQFDAFARQPQSQGRKLEFLSQEMIREINTIGSKANNVDIAHAVVEIKAAIERLREVLQNVE